MTPHVDSPAATSSASPLSTRRIMTYEEFLNAPDIIHAEWVNGEAAPMTAPSTEHQRLFRFLFRLFDTFIEERACGEYFPAPFNVKLGPELPGRQPDLVFIRNEHLDRVRRNHLEGPADLLIEVTSPESRGRDHGDKFYEYEQAGVGEYWIIDPQRQKAEFYCLGTDGMFAQQHPDPTGVHKSRTIPGLSVDPTWFWRNPHPSRADILRTLGDTPSDMGAD